MNALLRYHTLTQLTNTEVLESTHVDGNKIIWLLDLAMWTVCAVVSNIVLFSSVFHVQCLFCPVSLLDGNVKGESILLVFCFVFKSLRNESTMIVFVSSSLFISSESLSSSQDKLFEFSEVQGMGLSGLALQ